ncbi:MAG: hypothetical protein KKB51_17695 [Candidatus Riflebacteria bacterium]|nr:hypothetical protein [Candidatus Riflebacteria bacterium]
MKKIIIALLAVLVFATAPVIAGNMDGMQVDPNDKAVIAMLWMVMSDLQMCRSSMDQSMMDNVSAIGHLNNAQSALRKSEIDPAYYSLIGEVDKRISKIKFYLVMNERRAAGERINQLTMVIRNVVGGGNLPNTGGYNGYNPGYGSNYNPGYGNVNPSGGVPVRPEMPVNGQFSPSPMPTLPSGVVPVR